MTSRPLTLEQILTILKDTPPRIAALTGGLGEAQLHTPSNPGEWPANEVLAHLRACNDVWGGNMLAIITGDHPTLRGVNPRAWMRKTNYPELEFRPSLHAFSTQRAALLAVLEPLDPAGWRRTAVVIDMVGKTVERSVLFYAEKLARHERTHVKQMERIASTMQGGPAAWRSS